MDQLAGTGADWQALFAGDTTLVLEFGQRIDREIVDRVKSINALIQSSITAGDLIGVLETVPTFRSLAIVYDPCIIHPSALLERIRQLETQNSVSQHDTQDTRHWNLPVLYGTEHGPDLASVASLTGLSVDTVIDLHVNCTFSAYMLGFLPGYAFLGDTPAPLHLPRRSEPRLRVPAGSVAIAMQLTGIYPWESPAGWHILGNCPVPMFDAQASPPALLKAGDKISFTRIDEPTFDQLQQELATPNADRDRWLVKPK